MTEPTNRDLYDTGLSVLEVFLFRGKNPSIPSNRTSLDIISERARIIANEPEKLSMIIGNYIFYGYDFTKGSEIIDRYNRAVENTIKFHEISPKGVEELVLKGTIADEEDLDTDIHGWYITKLG